ncbi:YjaG family protein [Alishewanella sp. d11]|uniref:YjaG family protein n=1 Tax=Alishewanella sp. d11 TaxID=3414030 RepID=UPI003BF8C00F
MKQKANNFQLMRELSFHQQAAIAAALLERMLPNYQLFAEVSQFGDSKLLRNILDLCWEWLTVKKVKINFERLAEELELVTPEVTQFDMFGVYPAVDSATALDMMLNGISQQDAAEFINVAKISQATVARLIEYEAEELAITTEAELKKVVRDHPLMQYEMDCLAELIALVKPMHPVGREQMQQLKAWVREQGLTNLAMELPLHSTAAVSETPITE